jgi:hypothetical protein
MSLVDEIKKWAAVFSPALQLIPGVGPAMPFVNIVLAAVGEAEKPGIPGPEKFQNAVASAADAINIYNAQHGANFMSSEMMSAIQDMVNAGVKFCNALGVFKKSKPTS